MVDIIVQPDPQPFATRQDLLRAISQDSQARLTTDPKRKWRVGAGDGTTKVFNTPFVETTSIVGYVDGTVAPASLFVGTGTGGVDQINFTSAPELGSVLAVTVDAGAINVVITTKALNDTADEIRGYLGSIDLNALSDQAKRTLRAHNVTLAKYVLCGRRDILRSEDPLYAAKRDTIRYLEGVAKGDFKLPVDATPAGSKTSTVGSEDPVFDSLSARLL